MVKGRLVLTPDREVLMTAKDLDNSVEAMPREPMLLHPDCHYNNPFFLVRGYTPSLPDRVSAVCADNRCVRIGITLDITSYGGPGNWDYHLHSTERKPGRCGGRPVWSAKVFSPSCHPQSPVHLVYEYGSGVVKLHCYECEKLCGTLRLEKGESGVLQA